MMASDSSVSFERSPSSFLIENIDILPRGRALDIAMGSGRNAIYLAKVGYEVEGVDISQEAINEAIKLAEEGNVRIDAHQVDLETEPYIRREIYDLIICFNYLQRSLFQDIKNGLKVGGMVVYETFIIDQAKYGRPKNPKFLLERNELLYIFEEFRCLRYREGVFGDGRAVASIIAEKV